MTHQDFINKWNGKKQERRDSSNYAQCFDLVVGYIVDVYNLPIDTFSGLLHAYQIFTNPTERTGTHFDFIQNNLWTVPKQGDIIVWSNKYGPSGHTAIVHEADVNTITAFSQNDPTGSPCQLRKYNYMNILGFLRKITQSVGQDEIAKLRKEFAVTEKRLREEKDVAVKDLENRLQQEQKKLAVCDLDRQEIRKRTIEEVRHKLDEMK